MTAPTQELRKLSELAGRSPATVLTATERDNAAAIDRFYLGWRQAARAEAYDTLSHPAEARLVALRMLEQGVASRTPLHVELLLRYAMNGFRTEEIDRAIPAINEARRHYTRGSAADACLQIALGEMQRMRGAPERAVVFLAEAYRTTASRGMEQQHILATEKLARVMDWAGDHMQAISLIEEVIKWDRTRGRTVALSTDLYFRGSFNLSRGAYRAALADFEQSRALAPANVDPVGAGFLDLQTCATLIELRAFDRAKPLCRRASTIFTRYDEVARAQAQLLLARIAKAQGEPKLALALLGPLLGRDDVLASFASAPQAYRLRADINGNIGQTSAAYRDLDLYVRATERQRTSEEAKRSAVLRASFDADRAAARNAELQRGLDFSNERVREQAKRYTGLAWSAALGVLLLLVIVGMGVVHRRRLTWMANTDPLTGLRNRRFVREHERTLMAGYRSPGTPIALALIDMDHFKSINDTFGHNAGDEVLVAFAGLARSVLRKTSVIARWGGEEFIVFFPHTAEAEAVEALERLRTALQTEIITAAGPVPVRFSAGVTSFAGNENLQTVVRSADEALYRAKGDGRNRIETAGARDRQHHQSQPA